MSFFVEVTGLHNNFELPNLFSKTQQRNLLDFDGEGCYKKMPADHIKQPCHYIITRKYMISID